MSYLNRAHSSETKIETGFRFFVGSALWIGLLSAFGVLATSAQRCLEGTDEASWVICAANPWASPGYGIFFGFFLHPLWAITGHVAPFRIAGMLMILLAAGIFSFFLIQAGPRLGARDSLWRHRFIVFPSIGIAALTRYAVGIRTPGYDWVVLFGALLFASGWLWSESLDRPDRSAGWTFLCALGFIGIFLGKWLAVPGYLLLVGIMVFRRLGLKDGRKVFLCGLGWGLLFFLLFLFYATPHGVMETVKAGFAQLGTGSHSGLLSHYAVGFFKGSWQVLRAYPWIFVLYGGVWGILFLARRQRPKVSQVAGASFLVGLVLAIWRGYLFGGLTTFSKGMMITLVWLTGVFLMVRSFRKEGDDPMTEEQKRNGRRVFWMLGLLPLLNGIGTATGITDYFGHGLIFFVAVGWILLGQGMRCGLPVWCAMAAVFTLGMIQSGRALTSTSNNYRVGSVWVQNLVPLSVGAEQGRMWTFPSSATFLEKIYGNMKRWGFREGDPIVGITDCPGLVYLLGGVSPGACWYISHYLPENPGVKMNLANIREDTLARSWILVRESARENERLESAWPKGKGVPLPVPVSGEFFWPWGDGEGKPERIYLYRPAATSAPSRR